MSNEDRKLNRELNRQKQIQITDEVKNFISEKLDEEVCSLTDTSVFIPTLNDNEDEVYYKIVISQVKKNFNELYDQHENYKIKTKK